MGNEVCKRSSSEMLFLKERRTCGGSVRLGQKGVEKCVVCFSSIDVQ